MNEDVPLREHKRCHLEGDPHCVNTRAFCQKCFDFWPCEVTELRAENEQLQEFAHRVIDECEKVVGYYKVGGEMRTDYMPLMQLAQAERFLRAYCTLTEQPQIIADPGGQSCKRCGHAEGRHAPICWVVNCTCYVFEAAES